MKKQILESKIESALELKQQIDALTTQLKELKEEIKPALDAMGDDTIKVETAHGAFAQLKEAKVLRVYNKAAVFKKFTKKDLLDLVSIERTALKKAVGKENEMNYYHLEKTDERALVIGQRAE